MLQTFRRKLTSWLMLGFLGIAVVAIVITGFGTGGMGGLPSGGGGRSDTLVEVSGMRITADELERVIRRQLDAARQQDPEIDMGQFLARGAFEGLLEQMIVARALMAYGRDQGLVASDRMIDAVIANIPAFQNFTGQFDENAFRAALQAQGLTEQQLREEIAQVLMQRQLQMPIGMSARVPESMAVQYASLMLERRRGSVGLVPTEAMGEGIAPTDAEVAAYYQRNRTRYTVPERRVLRFAVLGREQLGQAAQATDEEIAAYYRENAARYAGTETRNLQQVVLPDEAAARAFVQRVRGGASFAEAARQAGFNATDIALGQQSREQYANISSPEVANAVFAAQEGAVVGPLRSELGFHVVRVEDVNRTAGRPLEAVRSEIVAEIERRKLQDALGALITRVEERIADGASFEEIVQAERLPVVETPPVTAAGAAPGAEWQAPQELQPLLRGAFQIDPEEPQPVVETITPNERYALVGVARVLPAAIPRLPEIAERVRADLIRERAAERARALAAQLVERINSGVPPARAFAEAGVRLPPVEQVNARRLDVAQGNQVPPPLVMLFSIPEGRARQLQAPNGAGWFVVHVAERTPGQATCPTEQASATQPPEGCRVIAAARAQFSRDFGTEYAEQFARAAQARVEIERDEEAIARARQRLQASAAQ
ncbi:MAG: SurA N-terminal domain-containing protein [Pseudomonadota bacterium]|nr:SurA N-terminal domain-containing protein [Pseudomonadota bacterium]